MTLREQHFLKKKEKEKEEKKKKAWVKTLKTTTNFSITAEVGSGETIQCLVVTFTGSAAKSRVLPSSYPAVQSPQVLNSVVSAFLWYVNGFCRKPR